MCNIISLAFLLFVVPVKAKKPVSMKAGKQINSTRWKPCFNRVSDVAKLDKTMFEQTF